VVDSTDVDSPNMSLVRSPVRSILTALAVGNSVASDATGAASARKLRLKYRVAGIEIWSAGQAAAIATTAASTLAVVEPAARLKKNASRHRFARFFAH